MSDKQMGNGIECVGGPCDGEFIHVPAWLNANGGIVHQSGGIYKLEIYAWPYLRAVWQGPSAVPRGETSGE